MTWAKRERKSRRNKKIAAPLLLCSLTCFFFSQVFAQEGAPKQFQQSFSIRGRVSGAILIVGWPSDAPQIEKLVSIVIQEAEKTFDALDAANPQSEVSMVNSNAGKGKTKVSVQVLDAFKAAVKVSNWTKGVFDIASSGGDYRSISIDEGGQTIELKQPGMQVKFDNMIDGYLADYMINLIYAANMQNTMVKVGNVFRGSGQSLHGPWKIQVQEDSDAYARHALNLTVSNTGIATISVTDFRSNPLIDYRSKQTVSPKCKGVTIVMNEAALAQGTAYAVFVLGPSEGINFLNSFGKARGLIVDAQGKFLRTAGL